MTIWNKMKSFIQISTTTETKEQAQKIGQYLVEQKLAACVQITGPLKAFIAGRAKWKRQKNGSASLRLVQLYLKKSKPRLKNFIPTKHRKSSPHQL